MHLRARYLREASVAIAVLLSLSGCSMLGQIDSSQPIDPSKWPDFSGEWEFAVVEPTSGQASLDVAICQNGPELWGAFMPDHTLFGLIHLDGTFALLVHIEVPGFREVWTISGNMKDPNKEFKGYYKPLDKKLFVSVKLKGHRRGPVERGDTRCPEGFKG